MTHPHVPQYHLRTHPDGRQTLTCTCGETWPPTNHRPLTEQRKKAHTVAARVVGRKS